MKSFNKEEKSLLSDIVSKAKIEHERFGYEIRHIWPKEQLGLLLLEKDCCILMSSLEKKETAFSKIVWYISFLTYCEQNNLIFCIEDNDYTGLLFSPQHNIDVASDPDSTNYTFKDGKILFDENKVTILDNENKTIMYGIKCQEKISKILRHFFSSRIYATSLLLELSDNDYQSAEERSLNKQLKDATRNFHIALWGLIISLIVPLLSVFISNKFGYSTITTQQFNKLINKMDNIEKILIINHKIDYCIFKDSINVKHLENPQLDNIPD